MRFRLGVEWQDRESCGMTLGDEGSVIVVVVLLLLPSRWYQTGLYISCWPATQVRCKRDSDAREAKPFAIAEVRQVQPKYARKINARGRRRSTPPFLPRTRPRVNDENVK